MYIEVVYAEGAAERTTHVKPEAVLEVRDAEGGAEQVPCAEIVTNVSTLKVRGAWADVLRAIQRAKNGGEARFEGVDPPEHLKPGWRPLGG